ncbi:FAD-dependent oxidoreductase [Streptomyces adustus]|uniref:FAD-dependent oxidoreductase n=1 Tax=Streptomyces adustus TaxID=1609272 RepID=UPI0035D6F66A
MTRSRAGRSESGWPSAGSAAVAGTARTAGWTTSSTAPNARSPACPGEPAALFGFAHARTVRPGFEQAVVAQLGRLFGPAAATPDTLHVQNWSTERWTSPSTVQRFTEHSLFGHPLHRRRALDGRLHWASTETATEYAGHVEGAHAAGERAARSVLTALATVDSPRADLTNVPDAD